MIRNTIAQIKMAEPAISGIEMDLFAKYFPGLWECLCKDWLVRDGAHGQRFLGN